MCVPYQGGGCLRDMSPVATIAGAHRARVDRRGADRDCINPKAEGHRVRAEWHAAS